MILGSVEYHILLVLADGSRHGYGIMREVEEHTAGRVRLNPSTLYGAITRLLDHGFIRRSAGGPAAPEGESRPVDESRRNYYRLTPAGREAILSEAERLESFLRLARVALNFPAPSTP